MSGSQNLIFGLHGALYGISANFVREICWLPELHSLATAPTDILGIFNWRSRMVPVMHLDLRFGRGFSGCNITDRLVVLELQGTYVAIVAHEVFDVRIIDPQPLDLELIQARQSALDRHFLTGIAQSNGSPVTCLDLDRLIREPDAVAALETQAVAVVAGVDADFYRRCYPQATVADRATFASRAAQLQTTVTQVQTVGVEEGVLVVQIGTEYIGLPLELVVDVDSLDRFAISPVPVAPRSILGQINWRGEIIPVLELASILDIAVIFHQEVVVVQIEGIKVGIAVNRIFDVFYLPSLEIETLPMAIGDKLNHYLRGVSRYADRLMYLLKLQELITREFLATTVV
jgi:purine-binding chemotaxis protein CheW